jgi:hypothetical protein
VITDTEEIDERTATALGLVKLDRKAVADRLAEIGGLPAPSRAETVELLVEVLLKALRQIPTTGAAWSWGEFHNGGTQPLYDISHHKDWHRMAVCAVDLGLDAQAPRPRQGRVLSSPRAALSANLTDAIEGLLHEVRVRLEKAGVTPYGRQGTPPPA